MSLGYVTIATCPFLCCRSRVKMIIEVTGESERSYLLKNLKNEIYTGICRKMEKTAATTSPVEATTSPVTATSVLHVCVCYVCVMCVLFVCSTHTCIYNCTLMNIHIMDVYLTCIYLSCTEPCTLT